MEQAKNSVLIFFSGIAVILGIVFFVYAVSLFADRLSWLNVATLTAEEVEARRLASNMTRDSGLAGLLMAERIHIYHHFFEKRAFPYEKPSADEKREPEEKDDDEDRDDIEAQNYSTAEATTEKENSNNDTAPADSSDKPTGESEQAVNSTEDADLDGNDAPSCSICLNEYENGEKVILGTSCSHMFHYDCCMQWVDKGHEHCPYCREHMITPTEFFDSAKEVLGGDRVDKLKKVNQEASLRMAELAAAGNNTISNPVPPVGVQPARAI